MGMTDHHDDPHGRHPPLRLAVIIGSTRENRFAPTVAGWFTEQLRARDDFELDLVDLLEVALPDRLMATADDAVRAFRRRIARADAFVIVTPEYNHGYPAPLKQAIDVAYAEWRAKPVGFVSYGGMSGGLRAVEQLRLVFAELHATTIRDCVSLHNPWSMADGAPLVGAEIAASTMLDQLSWWGAALRHARTTTPYAA